MELPPQLPPEDTQKPNARNSAATGCTAKAAEARGNGVATAIDVSKLPLPATRPAAVSQKATAPATRTRVSESPAAGGCNCSANRLQFRHCPATNKDSKYDGHGEPLYLWGGGSTRRGTGTRHVQSLRYTNRNLPAAVGTGSGSARTYKAGESTL